MCNASNRTNFKCLDAHDYLNSSCYLTTLHNNSADHIIKLTIQAHVLSKGLRQHNVMTLLNEVADSPSITVNVSTGKALVSHVKEHQQVPFLLGEKRAT